MVVFSFFSFFLTIKMKSVIFRFVVGGEPVLGWCCLFFLVCHILFVVARQRSYYNTVCTVCTLCNVCNVCNVLYHRCRRNTKKKEAATSSPSSSGTFFILVWDFPSSVTVVSLVHRLYAWWFWHCFVFSLPFTGIIIFALFFSLSLPLYSSRNSRYGVTSCRLFCPLVDPGHAQQSIE